MGDFGDELRAKMAERFERKIKRGVIDCPTDGCDSNQFDAEVWVADSGGFEATALCRACNTRIELNLEDSGAQTAADKVQDSYDDLKDALDSLDG
ncbi:hypothetical protein ACFQE8_23305 [Salinirubellus sp. GCM10025818]|uniref:hypothetical protein n=1 Tax=Salinirubellus TaxID=2162630 RepID=UPI0030CEED9A